MNNLKTYGIILASGTGTRFESDVPKQFVKIGNKTILEHSIEAFENANIIDKIIVVITPEYKQLAEQLLFKNNYKKIFKLIKGGETRKDSSSIAINSIEEDEANILIHDCARPLVTQKIISDCVEALKTYDAVGVAIPATDTVIEVQDDIVTAIPNRNNLRQIQTPQCFKLSLIKKAHELANNDKSFTDDCGLIVKYQLANVFVVNGDIKNFKITYPNDIFIAEKMLQNNKCNKL